MNSVNWKRVESLGKITWGAQGVAVDPAESTRQIRLRDTDVSWIRLIGQTHLPEPRPEAFACSRSSTLTLYTRHLIEC